MWQGVIIKESLKNLNVLDYVKIVGQRETTLESEGERGKFHFLNVEIKDNKVDSVLNKLKTNLKNGWYVHLVKGSVIHVAFQGKIMMANRDNNSEFKRIRTYAISIGIHQDQLPLEYLLDHPFD